MHDHPTRRTPKGAAAETDTSWIPEAGTIVAARYRLEHVIGRGGMGAVVAARHIALDHRVAVKFLDPELAGNAENAERFVREAKAAARINSDHVVRVFDVGVTEDGLHYIVMELLDGSDLAAVVAGGPVPLELAVDCVLQAAEALGEAHAAGIVHRDIKPANLWLSTLRDGSPHVRILDFGISKLAPTSPSTGQITDTQSVFGSPTYMSPEQLRSAKNVDPRTDVWALGIVLYELVTGELPFYADNVSGVIVSISNDPPRPVRPLRSDLPDAVERIIFACLEKDAGKRATLGDLATALAPSASTSGRAAADRIRRAGHVVAVVRPSRRPLPARSEADKLGFGTTQAAPDVRNRKSARIVSRAVVVIALGSVAFAVAFLTGRAPVPTVATAHGVDGPASAAPAAPSIVPLASERPRVADEPTTRVPPPASAPLAIACASPSLPKPPPRPVRAVPARGTVPSAASAIATSPDGLSPDLSPGRK